jgi:hypothetical protein
MNIVSKIVETAINVIIVEHVTTLIINSYNRNNVQRKPRISVMNRIVDRVVDPFLGR